MESSEKERKKNVLHDAWIKWIATERHIHTRDMTIAQAKVMIHNSLSDWNLWSDSDGKRLWRKSLSTHWKELRITASSYQALKIHRHLSNHFFSSIVLPFVSHFFDYIALEKMICSKNKQKITSQKWNKNLRKIVFYLVWHCVIVQFWVRKGIQVCKRCSFFFVLIYDSIKGVMANW